MSQRLVRIHAKKGRCRFLEALNGLAGCSRELSPAPLKEDMKKKNKTKTMSTLIKRGARERKVQVGRMLERKRKYKNKLQKDFR